MIAKVTLTCSKCGKEYEITHGVQTTEEVAANEIADRVGKK